MASWLILILALLCLIPDLPAVHWHAWPAWVGLLVGVLVALTLGNPQASRTRSWTSRLLAWSVMGLGAGMNLRTVAVVGLQGFGYTMIGISMTLGLGVLMGHWLKVRHNTSILVSVGTAICGGSAIAAAAPVLQADEEETSLALATVFLLNASALLVFPVIGHWLALGERPFGVWAALAIHDTSSVVGAASSYGTDALAVATTIKLARALWIVPLTLGLGVWVARREHRAAGHAKVKRPWFILGFLAAAALVTFFPALKPLGTLVSKAAVRMLVLTLFLLGLGLSRASVAKVGPRPFLQGVLLWIVVGSGTLGAILAGWIH